MKAFVLIVYTTKCLSDQCQNQS